MVEQTDRDPVLETREITKRFGALVASDSISINLVPGEIHAVIGPNGAGKSTLIKQICGGVRPDFGSVHFLQKDITGLPTPSRARLGLGRTFQISALAMEDTVLQNAVLGSLGATGNPMHFLSDVLADKQLVDVAMHALDRVGLAGQAETITSALSHGERVKAIATSN